MNKKTFRRALRRKIDKVDEMSGTACGFDGPIEKLNRFKEDLVDWVMAEMEKQRNEAAVIGAKSEHDRAMASGGPG